MLYSIIQANAAVFQLVGSPLLSLKILDTSSAASLFITLVGALLVRHQFALGVLPRINYKSLPVIRKNPHNADENFETWHVELRNTGLGSAITNRAEYFIDSSKANGGLHPHTFSGIKKELAALGLECDKDYWIEHISSGFSLSPKDDCFVFEIRSEHIEKLKRLDMVLYFQGQLGDKYRREIFLIPRF